MGETVLYNASTKCLLRNVHLSGFFILFAFEQNNSCLTKFFIKEISSKIFTPPISSLSREREGGGVHHSVPNCVPKLKHSKLVNSDFFFFFFVSVNSSKD